MIDLPSIVQRRTLTQVSGNERAAR
jgi:hypothetical protein